VNIRFAFRRLLARPWWALAFVLLVGCTAGMVTGLFAVADTFVFAKPPYREPDSIVHFRVSNTAVLRNRDQAERIRRIAEESSLLTERAFARFTWVFQPGGEAVVDWGVVSTAVSRSLFDLLGARPVRGRLFEDSEGRSIPKVAVISYQLWRDRFGSNSGVLDSEVEIPGTLDGKPWRIVGVMPPGFSFPDGTNFWIPFDPNRQLPTLTPDFARLTEGISIDTLRAQLPQVDVMGLADYVRPHNARAIVFLLLATMVLLLGAWTHGTSLLISRATGTVDTIGIRLALGATSSQIRREFAAEGFLLAAGSFVICLLTAVLVLPAILSWLPPEATAGNAVGLSAPPLLIATGITAVGVLLWVLVVGDMLARTRLISICRPLHAISGNRSRRSRFLLLVVETAVAGSLAYVGLSSVKSYARLSEVDVGFEPRGLLAVPLPLPNLSRGSSRDASRAASALYEERAREVATAIQRLPGVSATAFASTWPTAHLVEPIEMAIGTVPDIRVPVRRLTVTRGYAKAVGARVLDGGEPTVDETRFDPLARPLVQAAVVNETLARTLRAHGPVVNQTLSSSPALVFRIVGVISDVKQDRVERTTEPTLYPFLPDGRTDTVLLIRTTSADNALTIGQIRDLLPKDLSSASILNLEHKILSETSGPRARARLLSVAAAFGVILLTIGLVSAIGEALRQHRRAIAICLSLGAQRNRVVLDSVRPLTAAAAAGLAAGIGLGFGIMQSAGSALFGVSAVDWSTAALCCGAVFAAVVLSAWVVSRGVTDFRFARYLKEQ
jgi:putative ABC transport system permease protein